MAIIREKRPDGMVLLWGPKSRRKGDEEHVRNPGAIAERLSRNSPPPTVPEPEKPLTKKDVDESLSAYGTRVSFWTLIFMGIFKLFGKHRD